MIRPVELFAAETGMDHEKTNEKEELRRRIIESIIWDGRIDAHNIQVDIYDSTVCLSGTVSNWFSRKFAEDDAWSAGGGIKFVKNDIEVRSTEGPAPDDNQIQSMINSALQWNPEINSDMVSAQVKEGVVRLSGSTDSYWCKMHVEEVVADLRGVVRIINEITVVPTRDLLDQAIAEHIVEELKNNPDIPLESIDIKVELGKLTISGSVPDWRTFKAVQSMAERMLGIRDIDNRLIIMP